MGGWPELPAGQRADGLRVLLWALPAPAPASHAVGVYSCRSRGPLAGQTLLLPLVGFLALGEPAPGQIKTPDVSGCRSCPPWRPLAPQEPQERTPWHPLSWGPLPSGASRYRQGSMPVPVAGWLFGPGRAAWR
uniref:Uncharacterized protein n=1 Tax=Rousettus aegyptiacus TaxID=9407 RepID=A0A7J8H1X7_ROUAE|nr:hypothetical protein HJG63_011445 [Rousettus aegyptiacus]